MTTPKQSKDVDSSQLATITIEGKVKYTNAISNFLAAQVIGLIESIEPKDTP